MKKRAFKILTAVLITVSLSMSTVYAKNIRSRWFEEKLELGNSVRDVYKIVSMAKLSGVNVYSFVEAKFDELKSWDAVAEHYNVDIEKFNEEVDKQLYLDEQLEIPDNIYAEMKAFGMTDSECKSFMKRTFNSKIDINTTWQAHKNGVSINSLLKEIADNKNQQEKAAIDLTYGRISEKEYINKMRSLAPDMTTDEIMAFASDSKNRSIEIAKVSSGITQEEITFGNSLGITNIFDLIHMKGAERISFLTFREMLVLVKDGANINQMLNNNTSQSKIENAYIETQTAAE